MGLILRRNVVGGKLVENRPRTIFVVSPEQFTQKERQVLRVTHLGPQCEEVQVSDLVLLPPHGGTEITVWDNETDEAFDLTVIEEHVILAILREDAV